MGYPRPRTYSILRGRVLGRAVQHADGNHGGEAAGHAARIKEVEAGLIASRFVEIAGLVPRVDR